MAIWALGYATKKGMVALADDGRKVLIKAKAIGNMFAPDPASFVADFLKSVVLPDDIVLTPSGPNDTYIAGCASVCEVHWVNPTTLSARQNGAKGKDAEQKAMFVLWKNEPVIFYEFQPTQSNIARLRIMVMEWLALEKQKVADGNAISQHLRREGDYFHYFHPDRDDWVTKCVAREMRKTIAQLKKRGVELDGEQLKAMKTQITDVAMARYNAFFEEGGGEAEKQREQQVADRLAWFGIDDILAEVESETRRYLGSLPENQLFDGLISAGTHRVRAQILAFVRNPLRYENVRALLSYAGVSAVEGGQATQRRHGETHRGHPGFKKALCFDFGEKYWMNDTVGYFQNLYYAYKAFQYQMYWELMEITADVFKAFGVKPEEADTSREREDSAHSDDGTGNGEEEVAAATSTMEVVQSIVTRLNDISHLPMIALNPHIKQMIAELESNPDPILLKRLFWRGRVSGQEGLNLQLTPMRIERRVKRMLGTVLLKAVYYRWRAQLKARLPFDHDPVYLAQFKSVWGANEIPTEFDIETVIEHFRQEAARLRKQRADNGASLPDEIEQKFVPPSQRKKSDDQATGVA